MRTKLEGRSYVMTPEQGGAGALVQVAGGIFGAEHLSQYILDLDKKPSGVFSFDSSEVILFAVTGSADVTISGEKFEMPEHAGLYVRPGEAFQVKPDGRFRALVTNCPECPVVNELGEMPSGFDETFPIRVVESGKERRQTMADRFYRVLVSKRQGSETMTQFIGEIPAGKAPAHHHHYEEVIYVLKGKGVMWTGGKKAGVAEGSVIFLPEKQEHSLECTSKGGLTVVGHFTPAGSPAENY